MKGSLIRPLGYLSMAFAGLLLQACVTVPEGAPAASAPEDRAVVAGFLKDSAFRAPVRAPDADKLFELTPEMEVFVHDKVMLRARSQGGAQALLDALYVRRGVFVEYDGSYTRTPQEAFASQRGNCLSLSLMTAALAKRLDLPVRYQLWSTDPLWSRGDTLDFKVLHIDVSIDQSHAFSNGRNLLPSSYTVDFVPVSDKEFLHAHIVPERRVVAMFFNNRAAELLEQRAVDEAYWWAREAVLRDAHFATAFNTLSLILHRQGERALALAALKHALELSPDDTVILGNLARYQSDAGQVAEALQTRQRLQRLQPVSPFHGYDEGERALAAGDALRAMALFRPLLESNSGDAQLHFDLAVSHYLLQQMDEAQREMRLATQYADTSYQRQRFAAKLAKLERMSSPQSGARP